MGAYGGWPRFLSGALLLCAGIFGVRAGEAPGDAPVPEVSWAGKVVVIELRGAIMGPPFGDVPEQALAALDKAEREAARAVVFDIDSLGGEVNACDNIANRLLRLAIPNVSFVTHRAVSGGAMLALACEELVMATGSRLGDIQPMATGLGGDYAPMEPRAIEKIEADVRAQLRAIAKVRVGRPATLLEAMVSSDLEITRVRFADNTTEFLDRDRLDLLEANIEQGLDPRVVTGKTLVSPAGKLLELAAEEAVELGVADATAASRAAFFAARDWTDADLVTVTLDKAEPDLSKLLPNLPRWAYLLLLVCLVVAVAGLWLESATPGVGVPGTAGFIALVAFFAILVMHDRGSWLGIALFVVGVALLLVEIILIPGFGLPGFMGIVLIGAGLFLAYAPDLLTEEGSAYFASYWRDELGAFLLLFFGALLLGGALVWLVLSRGERVPFLRGMFMSEALRPGAEVWAQIRTASGKDPSGAPDGTTMVGRVGTAMTPLGPSGKVAFEGSDKVWDAATVGEWIDAGTRVRVIGAEYWHIIVAVESAEKS